MTANNSPKLSRLEREKKTIRQMIGIYCRRNHRGDETLCEDCGKILEYAIERLSRCPFGEDKPACSRCRVHCYQPANRERIREIMRFSGPRMIIYHPLALIAHTIKKITKTTY